MARTITIDVECPVGMYWPDDYIRAEVTIMVTYEGTPGRLWGRPEDCWPAEGPTWSIEHLRMADRPWTAIDWLLRDPVVGAYVHDVIDGTIEDAIEHDRAEQHAYAEASRLGLDY